jgi:serine protease
LDPGDWVTSADKTNFPDQFKNCAVADSSWHGTRTAGILGALTDNGTGMAGMNWNSRILPVRVLGKCGGFDSDIIAGMLWAAGITVTGVPPNPNPARIINMSLGATSMTCPDDYADAVRQVTAKGVLVVVSAGNEGGPVDVPARCPGVAGIAAIRHSGTKVGFSNLGPELTVASPGGNCVNPATGAAPPADPYTVAMPCEYSIVTAFNTGKTNAAVNGSSYTDNVHTPNLGTSFSAPIVSGIAGLMLSVNSNLNSCQLLARLKEGATPFPQSSTTVAAGSFCHVPASATDSQKAECICTLDGKTCGAGMANAPGAIAAALRPIAVVTLPTLVSAGKSVSLSAVSSVAAGGHTIATYQWTSTGAQAATIQNGTSATPTVTAPSCGYATLQLAVSDETGLADTADVVLSPTSATSSAPSTATPGTCTTTVPAVLLAVCPATSSVVAGSGTQTLTASVANTTDASVTWSVNGIAGGNATVGTISTSGVYTAPATMPAPSTVTVEAVSQADQTVTSSTQVTVTAPPKSGGGGALDPFTLLAEALVLGAARVSRRYLARRCYARR